MSTQPQGDRHALHVAFDAGDQTPRVLHRAHGAVQVAAAIVPCTHKRLTQDGAGWTSSMLVFPEDESAVEDVSQALLTEVGQDACRLARMRLQPTIDMLYPKRGLRAERSMMQLVEYVTSKPEERDDYYQCQYDVSGPAMRSVWETGVMGRFVGFELTETLHRRDGFPDWDVIHLAGGSRFRALRFVWSTRRALDQHSRDAGRGSMKELMEVWERQRLNVKSTFKQPVDLTRQSEALARELPR